MAVSVSPIKIISDLGYNPWEIENDEDYLSALKEATNEISIANPGDGRVSMLQDEVRRVRADRKAADPKFKARKTKINVGSFLGRDAEPQKLLGPSKDQNKKTASGGLVDTIDSIAEAVGRIENTLIEQKKLDEDKIKNDKQLSENLDRDNEESRLGKVTGFLKKAGDKIIAPVQGIFSQIFGFIKKLILGKIFLNIIKWFGNPANQGKIDGVIKFFSNNWKKLLSLYLVFGTGIGKFVRFITKVAIKGVLRLGVLLAKIAAAKGVKGARGFAKMLGGKKGAMIATGVTAVTSLAMYGGVNKMLGGGEKEEPQKFNKGGKVRGQGDKDTVPAMLTPGEFVMSKGAVQQYGVDTMEAMNAAAGGTNTPVLMPDKKRKGFPGGGRPYAPTSNAGVVTDPKEIQEQEAYMLKFVNEERAFQGLPPLTNLTYAPGVELTKMRGPGPRTKETSDTFTDLNRGIETTSTSKTVDGKTTFGASMRQTTEEDRQKFFAENPHAAQLVNLKNQVELDNLGADISSSAKMKGGGLVQGFQGGGLVGYTNLGQTPMAQMSELREERKEILRRQVNGKWASKEDKERYREVNAQIKEIKNKIKAIATSKSTSTSTPTPTQTPVTEKKKSGGLFGGGKKEGGSSGILGPISSNVDAMVNTDQYEVKPKEKKNVVVAYEQEASKEQQQQDSPPAGGNDIPAFDVRPPFMTDQDKMMVLGMRV